MHNHSSLSEQKTPRRPTRTRQGAAPAQIAATDAAIDGLVYELYGLTEEEIAIIAGKLTLLNNGIQYVYIIRGADMDFKISIEQDEDGWYIVTVPALPGCVSQGKTEEEAKKNIAEAIELHLSALARDGIPLYHRPGMKETFVAVDI